MAYAASSGSAQSSSPKLPAHHRLRAFTSAPASSSASSIALLRACAIAGVSNENNGSLILLRSSGCCRIASRSNSGSPASTAARSRPTASSPLPVLMMLAYRIRPVARMMIR
jgi:hypothetical protein